MNKRTLAIIMADWLMPLYFAFAQIESANSVKDLNLGLGWPMVKAGLPRRQIQQMEFIDNDSTPSLLNNKSAFFIKQEVYRYLYVHRQNDSSYGTNGMGSDWLASPNGDDPYALAFHPTRSEGFFIRRLPVGDNSHWRFSADPGQLDELLRMPGFVAGWGWKFR